jgi:hypothetical protein
MQPGIFVLLDFLDKCHPFNTSSRNLITFKADVPVLIHLPACTVSL